MYALLFYTAFEEYPALDSPFKPSGIELVFVGLCAIIIVLGFAAFFGTMRKLKAAENPSRDMIVEYFRGAGATDPEHAVPKKELPFYMTDNSTDSLTFQTMEQRKIIKKVNKAYYLDEDVLARFIGGKQ